MGNNNNVTIITQNKKDKYIQVGVALGSFNKTKTERSERPDDT